LNYLVTGCAGFIGYHVTRWLLRAGHKVVGIDSMNDYYPRQLKEYRRREIHRVDLVVGNGYNFQWINGNILHLPELEKTEALERVSFDAILHFAAYPGVRYSIENPGLYTTTNIDGSLEVLEFARRNDISKVLLASSSSVYGDQASRNLDPIPESQPVDPLSPYAASKAAMEIMGLAYHNLYGMDILIPRYFTVYGEAGRPDMAYFKFMLEIAHGRQIEVYGDGRQRRDMTYIDDAVDGTLKMLSLEGYHVLNIGTGCPVALNKVISLVASNMHTSLDIQYTPHALGDPFATCANIDKAKELLGWIPRRGIEYGLELVGKWFTENGEWLMKIFR